MNKPISFLLFVLFFLPCFVIAQNHYNIRLQALGEAQEGKITYQVQLSAADGIPLNLAGQNYRLYFDASLLKLDKAKSETLLSTTTYTPFLWKEVVEKVDAAGVGSLPYNQTLGLINFGIDLEDNKTGGITLPATGDWMPIASLSFDLINQENTGLNNEEAIISWARPSLTSAYASAYVEVAEWINAAKTIPALVDSYYDQSFTTSIVDKEWTKEISIYPNPVSHQLNIQYESTKEIELEIWDIQGKRLFRATLPKGNHLVSNDFSKYASGAYQIRMIQDDQIYTKLIERIR